MRRLIDSHVHMESFEDPEVIVQQSKDSGVDAVICVGGSLESSKVAKQLALEHPGYLYPALGVHPSEALKDDIDAAIAYLRENLDGCVAVGEIGLDYFRMHATKEKQHKALRMQVRLARKYGLPIIIHNREAHDDILTILKEEKAEEISGVFHSFTGELKFLESILAQNYHVSFTGPVTFKNTNYNKLIDCVPVEQLLLETDSPFLAPAPFRGKRNEPAYVKYIAEKIAQVKGITLEKLAEITSENAQNLFHLRDQWQLKLNL